MVDPQIPSEFLPFVQNEFANKGLCQLTFDQAVELTKSIDTLQRALIIILIATVTFYLILLYRFHQLGKQVQASQCECSQKDSEKTKDSPPKDGRTA